MSFSFSFFTALFAVIFLCLVSLLGVQTVGLRTLFGVVIPYAALAIFVLGFIYRMAKWASSSVPFRIPSTCGQQKTLPWIKQAKFDNPSTGFQTLVRMLLEVLLFRSLFRNTKAEVRDLRHVAYGSAKWLWLAGILFHYSFLTIVVRHIRFFTEPEPYLVNLIATLDGIFEIAVPTIFLTDIALLAAATYLFLRRVVIPNLRYISLPADYFPLLLILAIAISGVLMRNVYKVDLLTVKQLALGLVAFHPAVPDGIGAIFFVHLFLVCCLLAYFPFSKLMHLGGVFLSPTRNMANNNRAVRHINPWDPQVKFHTYEEYEDDFRVKMKEAGIPVDKE
ncbi:MAG: sulfate reduction electron transfer complex DsrMKJOP subunit DsrM [Thermodesulfobacteriota bacterium]